MEPAEYDLMDAAEDGMWWFRAAHARIIDALRTRPGAAGPVLDAGCGTGGFLLRLAQQLPDRPAIGLEYMAEAAGRAARKSGRPVTAGDANALPFADASFGAAVAIDVICHAGVDPRRGMAELHRVLQPGGTVVLNLPAYEWLRSAHDARVHTARRYTARSARALLAAAGFTRISTRYWNGLLLPLMALQRKVLQARPGAPSDVADFPPWIDKTLYAVSETERRIGMAGIPMPGGGSVLVIGTRP